jgi:hypothetical protein
MGEALPASASQGKRMNSFLSVVGLYSDIALQYYFFRIKSIHDQKNEPFCCAASKAP